MDAPKTDAALAPGLTVCADCRSADAVLTSDPGERWARHLCFDCAEDELDRLCTPREFHELLVRARSNPAFRPLPVPPLDWESCDWSKVEALRGSWVRFRERVRDLERCWALLPGGGRCVRRASAEGVCETHWRQGCTVPGLGWSGETPQGRMMVRQRRSAA